MFPIAQAHVSGIVLVGDQDMRAAQRALWRAARLVAEPAGAASVAVLLSGAYRPAPGERVAAVISGANTTLAEFDPPGPAQAP